MNRFFYTFCALFFCTVILLTSCKADEQVVTENPYLELNQSRLEFMRFASEQNITVKTNIADLNVSVTASGEWCTAVYKAGLLTIKVADNEYSTARTAIVFLKGDGVNQSVYVSQNTGIAGTDQISYDSNVSVAEATASSSQSGLGIENSIDGNTTTLYHSVYTSTPFPVTLTYNFSGVDGINYIVYYPRTDGGTNGNFQEFDLYVATKSNPILTKYGTYNFLGNSSVSTIVFSDPLINPTQIQFVVKSGKGNYVSCSEMKFFKKNNADFDTTLYFTDGTCSALKVGVTLETIKAINNEFFKQLALELFYGKYNTEFRVQEYKAWQHPNIVAALNKNKPYSLHDNPTGIYASAGEDIVVFAGDLHRQNISVFIQNPSNKTTGSYYPISKGMNKFKALNEGLMYVMYHTTTGTESSVKLNFATGIVNGYFDSQKHTPADWNRLLGKAAFRHFDVLGKYAHLTFETDKFKKYTPDGLSLINLYDDIVYKEMDNEGLVKYNRMSKNRMYLLVVYDDSYMYSTDYYTAYVTTVQEDLLTLNKIKTNPWGVAHEIGHSNQVKPNFCWLGMTEVTNNVQSLFIQTFLGNTTRLINENYYAKAKAAIITPAIAHNAATDVFCKLVPFWQLKLYMIDVLGKTDFYKDLYEKLRNNTSNLTYGQCQIEFVKAACDVAKLDLTDFFTVWGFLSPINQSITDYSTASFIVTQSMIDECKAYIASKGYTKPTKAIQDITDNNYQNF